MSQRVGKAPTIYDVAALAEVAPSTVSRAFSRPGRVGAETAERIRTAAAELGYRTNPIARALSTSRSGVIALSVADIANPHFHEIIRGAEAACAEAGYTMLLSDAQESDLIERKALERALPGVDGVVLAGSRMSDRAIRMVLKQRPVVVLNRVVTSAPSLVSDSTHGVREAVSHLHGLGHSSITYAGGPAASWADGVRWRAIVAAGADADLEVRRLGPYPPTVAGGVQAARELTSDESSAVIAYNDLLAIGLMRGLSARDVEVPDQMSIVGFDNILAADLVRPGLTTIAAPLHDMGTMAVQTLLAIVGGKRASAGRVAMLPTRLIVRESTGQRSRKRTSPA